jgi:dipeptide/tripeptide permease
MIPEEIFKRRKNHNNTPPTVLLILTNCIVMALLVQAFTGCNFINNFFWVATAVLALYNVYTIRRNREEYNRVNVIIYVCSLAFMAFLFFYYTSQPHNC